MAEQLADILRLKHGASLPLPVEPAHCDRLAAILRWRFATGEREPAREIAARFGIAQSRVYQISIEGVAWLRAAAWYLPGPWPERLATLKRCPEMTPALLEAALGVQWDEV